MKAKVIFTTLLIETSPQALPLGAACVASAVKHSTLTQNLCEVQLLPFNKENPEFEKHNKTEAEGASYIAEQILKQNPAVVGFSVFVWNRMILEQASEILRSKGIKTFAGGPEITAHPEIFTAFDKVISGEGEQKVPPVVYEFLTGKNVPTESSTPDASNTTEAAPEDGPSTKNTGLENLPSPYLDGTLDPSDYEGALWELARGCPFKCSYCYESKGAKNVRSFPMERIEKELDLFAKKKIPQVFVLDPTYNANKDRALKLLNLIAKKTPDTFYYFEARAEFIDRQLAKAFTKIPCALQIGLQSADEEVLKKVHRPFNKKTFVKNIGILNQEGVIFGFDLIYGLPGESLSGFRNGIDFALSLYPNNLELFCLSVLPGTDLCDRAKELHLEYESEPPYHIIKTDKISPAEIKTADKLSSACTIFYNQGRAVPWFNTICHAAKIKPSQFFQKFSDFISQNQEFSKFTNQTVNYPHIEIEKAQKAFITKLFNEKNLQKYLKAALDLITFNGAVSRKTDTGKSEKIKLNYPAEYIDSEYAMDLDFFINNVKMRTDTIVI